MKLSQGLERGQRPESGRSPFRDAAIALLVTVIGGVVVAWLIQDARFSPEPGGTPTPNAELSPTSRPTETPVPPTATSRPIETPTPAYPPAEANVGDTWTRPKDGMVMVYVPAGDFNMGSTEWYDNEQPVHSVVLDGFWIDATEVTNAQYRRCMEAGACNPPAQISSPGRDSYYDNGTYDGFPVIYVNWHQAETYCGWVGARLPTEAEWEYAARGNEARVYPWGNTEPDCDRANRGGCVGNTAAVGSYPAGVSWCGALDMAGNVWEWVSDWYGDYPSDQQVNPQGPLSGEHRVLRGGSWDYDPNNPPFDVHSAYRGQFVPADSTYTIGFRCAWGSE